MQKTENIKFGKGTRLVFHCLAGKYLFKSSIIYMTILYVQAYVLCRKLINIHRLHFILMAINVGAFCLIIKGDAVGEEHQQRR